MALSRAYKIFYKCGIICLLLSILLSCSTLGKSKKNDEGFLAAVEQFNTAVRWQDFRGASAMIAPALRNDFWNLADELHKSVRLMDFELRDSSFDASNLSGEATLRFRYYYTTSPQIRTKTIQEKYRYSEKEELWQVVQHDMGSILP